MMFFFSFSSANPTPGTRPSPLREASAFFCGAFLFDNGFRHLAARAGPPGQADFEKMQRGA